MKIFVTGGSGFVGGAIIESLAKSHEIFALSRSEESDKKLSDKKAQTVRGDLHTLTSSMFTGIDVVIHCAAFVGPWGTKDDFWKGNVVGTKNILEFAKSAGVKRFIHMSTEAAIFSGIDLVEIDENFPYPEKTPYHYSSSKQAAEKLVIDSGDNHFNCLVLRPRLVWGKGDTSVLPTVMRLVKEGKFMWIDGGKKLTSTTNIKNLVLATELALTKGENKDIFFITDDEYTTYFDFVTMYLGTQNLKIPNKSIPTFIASFAAFLIESIWNILRIKKEPPLMRFATDIMARTCTIKIDKAKNILGYKPIINIRNGMAEL
jgi:nucleoside-diphosphate-sugar epimerase